MNLRELTDYLHVVFGGSEKHNSKVEEILEKSDLESGLPKAYEYYESSKKGQKNCRSDWAYWMYAGDISLAKALIAIMLHLKKGNKVFPQFPTNRGDFLMNQTAQIEEWAHSLMSDHKHEYVMINLKHGEKNEDYPEGCPFAGIIYDRCKICGDKKYGWEPPPKP